MNDATLMAAKKAYLLERSKIVRRENKGATTMTIPIFTQDEKSANVITPDSLK
jgi:hypothetical protein